MKEFEIGQEVWTDFNGRWQKVTLIEKKYELCEGGVSYKTKPNISGFLSIAWFKESICKSCNGSGEITQDDGSDSSGTTITCECQL